MLRSNENGNGLCYEGKQIPRDIYLVGISVQGTLQSFETCQDCNKSSFVLLPNLKREGQRKRGRQKDSRIQKIEIENGEHKNDVYQLKAFVALFTGGFSLPFHSIPVRPSNPVHHPLSRSYILEPSLSIRISNPHTLC